MPRPDEAAPALIYKEGEDIVLDGETYDDPLVAVRSKTITLTDAQIKVLPTTPIQILPLPATGKRYHYISGTSKLALSAAYSSVEPDASLFISYGNGGMVSATPQTWADQLMESSGEYVNDLPQGTFIDTFVYPNAGYLGEANYAGALLLKLRNFNAGAINLTGGHADNNLKVTVLYTIIDV